MNINISIIYVEEQTERNCKLSSCRISINLNYFFFPESISLVGIKRKIFYVFTGNMWKAQYFHSPIKSDKLPPPPGSLLRFTVQPYSAWMKQPISSEKKKVGLHLSSSLSYSPLPMCSLVVSIVSSSSLHFQRALQLLGRGFCIRKYFRMNRQTFTLTSSNEAWLLNTMGIEVKETVVHSCHKVLTYCTLQHRPHDSLKPLIWLSPYNSHGLEKNLRLFWAVSCLLSVTSSPFSSWEVRSTSCKTGRIRRWFFPQEVFKNLAGLWEFPPVYGT